MKEGLKKKPTQCQRVLQYVADNGSISAFEAFSELGISQLASRIFELERQGYKFKRERIYKDGRYGKVNYNKYEIEEFAEV